MTGPSMIYLPDRIVAGISCMFFILSVLSCYYILLRMFDVTIACFTCLTMILSNLFLQYATSGLPQMMMLFFFAWGIHFCTRLCKTRRKTAHSCGLSLAAPSVFHSSALPDGSGCGPWPVF